MAAKPGSENAELGVINANSHFTRHLYKELATKDGNIFFSPISAHVILSLAYQGASGATRDAFAKVLCVPDESAAAEGYHQVMTRLNSVEDVTLLMANKVYLMNKYKLQDDFDKVATEKFLSEVEKVDFADNIKTASVINQWVEGKTHNKIKNLVASDSLSADTRLILVNAIYFKGNWARKFNAKSTQKLPFYINEDDHVEVDMMYQSGNFKYKYDQELEAQVLELPYTNPNISFIVILPRDRTGINNLEEKLHKTDFTKFTENMFPSQLEVQLPKFKMETKIDLKDVLTKMGLHNIFTPGQADFSKLITDSEELYVSEVIQKAFIEVNEEGATAAAATTKIIKKCSLPLGVYVDHPFLMVLIAKNENGVTILFSGIFRRPL